MCAKHSDAGQRKVQPWMKRASSWDAVFILIVILSTTLSFYIGYTRYAPAGAATSLEQDGDGPTTFVLNDTVSRYKNDSCPAAS